LYLRPTPAGRPRSFRNRSAKNSRNARLCSALGPVRVRSVKECISSWRSDFLLTTAACVDEFHTGLVGRGFGGHAAPRLASLEELLKMSSKITSTADNLAVYLRHYCSHAAELQSGTEQGGRPTEHIISALTTNPFTRSRFPSRFEYYIRHPATGWFWPRLWRSIYTLRATLPDDVLDQYHVPH
jgi:hypothetical protein